MIEVACALILHEGKALVTQRGLRKAEGGLWEFPGGKLEAGETAQQCIVREIMEELSITIIPYASLPASVHAYPSKTIKLLPLLCHWQGGHVQLHEHAAYQWLPPEQLADLKWCPADIPVIEQFLQWLKEQH